MTSCVAESVNHLLKIKQDAPVKAAQGHRPPVHEGQGREVDEQLKEGDAGHRPGLLEAPLGHPAALCHLWHRHHPDHGLCTEEVRLQQRHQLGEDEGLGGRRVLPRAAQADQRGLGRAGGGAKEQAKLQGLGGLSEVVSVHEDQSQGKE